MNLQSQGRGRSRDSAITVSPDPARPTAVGVSVPMEKGSRVSHVAVALWLSGKRNPSRMALMLAGELRQAPIEMVPGLPALNDER